MPFWRYGTRDQRLFRGDMSELKAAGNHFRGGCRLLAGAAVGLQAKLRGREDATGLLRKRMNN